VVLLAQAPVEWPALEPELVLVLEQQALDPVAWMRDTQ
jgi:hypothetical protein